VVADYKSITISFFSLFLTITLGTILLISKDIFLNSEIAKIVSEKNFMNTLKNFVNTLKNFVDTENII
jgi:hypothetical protein